MLSAWLLVIGGGLAALGSVLPWRVATEGGKHVLSTAGLRGNGWLTLVLGVAVLVVGLLGLRRRGRPGVAVAVLVAGVAITVVAGYNAFDLGALGDTSDQTASYELGHGLLMALIGGVLTLVGGARFVGRA